MVVSEKLTTEGADDQSVLYAKATLVMLSEESREKMFAEYLKEKGWDF